LTVEETIDEVQVARPAAAGANGEFARQMRFGAGRECGDLLVPHVNPFDLSLSSDSVGQTVKAVANNAVDPLDARGGECFDELICYRSSHDFRLPRQV
jgi:hypothetical protein